jgi:hypothetical protein
MYRGLKIISYKVSQDLMMFSQEKIRSRLVTKFKQWEEFYNLKEAGKMI